MNRHGFIGSADAPIIFNGSPMALLRLWEEKTGISQRTVLNSDAICHGNRLEPEAREFFSEKMGEVFWPCRIFHDEHMFMRASFDGMNFSEKKAVEIKCPYSSNLLEDARKGKFDRDHIIQMQHQMFVANLDMIFYLIYKSPEDYEIFEILKDKTVIDELVEKECVFWEKVLSKKPPVEERNDPIWESIENAYVCLHEKESEIKKEKEALLDKLKELSGGSSVLGKKIVLTRYFRRGSIRYSSIPELKNVDLEKYREKDLEVWSTTIRKM